MILGRGAAGEMRFDLIGQMMHVDDRRADSGLRKTVEQMVDHRFAADFDERLRDRLRQRPHAQCRAPPRRPWLYPALKTSWVRHDDSAQTKLNLRSVRAIGKFALGASAEEARQVGFIPTLETRQQGMRKILG